MNPPPGFRTADRNGDQVHLHADLEALLPLLLSRQFLRRHLRLFLRPQPRQGKTRKNQ